MTPIFCPDKEKADQLILDIRGTINLFGKGPKYKNFRLLLETFARNFEAVVYPDSSSFSPNQDQVNSLLDEMYFYQRAYYKRSRGKISNVFQGLCLLTIQARGAFYVDAPKRETAP